VIWLPFINLREAKLDYNEMLFAYHVRKEALEKLHEEMTDDISREEFEMLFNGIIEDIVSSTRAIAFSISRTP
jgi:hypothetical protein